MRFLKKFLSVSLACGLLSCLLWGCSVTRTPTNTSTPLTPQLKLTAADQNTIPRDATAIELNTLQNACVISSGGTYLLYGSLQGCIRVDAEDQIVHLVLRNVDVKSISGPALEICSAGKVILTLPDGTVNTLQDSGSYPVSAEADACIYSVCDLTVNGSGKLTVSGKFKDGIHSKDVLKILTDYCTVTAKRDALHGNDGIVLMCKNLELQCERNGLHATKTGKPGKGNLEISNTTGSIISGEYAFYAAADLYLADSRIFATGIRGVSYAAGASYITEGSLQK